MLEFRFDDASHFKKIVDALKDVVKEVNFECNCGGIAVQAMDPTHVALVSLFMPHEMFSFYRCDESAVTLGVNLETLVKMIRPIPNNAPISLRKNECDDELTIVGSEAPESENRRVANMKLVEVDAEHLQIPEVDYQAQVHFPTKHFQSIVRDLYAVAENVKIRVGAKTIGFDADGEQGRVENVFHKGKGIFGSDGSWRFQKFHDGQSDQLQQEFSIRYLTHFAKAAPISEFASISMSEGVPLRVMFQFGSGDPSGHLAFYLAPKLDE